MKCLEECGRYVAISMELEGSAPSWRTRLWKMYAKELLGNFLPRVFYYVIFFCLYIMCRSVLPSSLYFHLHLHREEQISTVADRSSVCSKQGVTCAGSRSPRVMAVLSPGSPGHGCGRRSSVFHNACAV